MDRPKVINQGLYVDTLEAQKLQALFTAFNTQRHAFKYTFEGAELVYNEFDREFQLQTFYRNDQGEMTEGDIVACLRGDLVAVLRCQWCDQLTNELFSADQWGESDEVCQLCLEG